MRILQWHRVASCCRSHVPDPYRPGRRICLSAGFGAEGPRHRGPASAAATRRAALQSGVHHRSPLPRRSAKTQEAQNCVSDGPKLRESCVRIVAQSRFILIRKT